MGSSPGTGPTWAGVQVLSLPRLGLDPVRGLGLDTVFHSFIHIHAHTASVWSSVARRMHMAPKAPAEYTTSVHNAWEKHDFVFFIFVHGLKLEAA